MSANDSLTPDELGELLKRGEITKEEAIEIMAQRTRSEAMQNLYGPVPGTGDEDGGAVAGKTAKPSRTALIVVLVLVVLFVLLAIALG